MSQNAIKLLAEVFGYAPEDRTDQVMQIRNRYWCPFVDKICSKQSRRIGHPFGVCSVKQGSNAVAICPVRFRQGNVVFRDIAHHYFGTASDLIPFSEQSIRTQTRGGTIVQYTFDYVLVKHKPFSQEIEDFVVIEYQTVDTTETGGLVDAFKSYMEGADDQNRRYIFGMNWANVWKRCFTQVLRKGAILESWGHKIYWVAQAPTYQYLVENYGLYDLGFNPDHKTVFLIYDLKSVDGSYELVQTRVESSTIEDLFSAFHHNTPIPSKDAFIEKLKKQIQRKQSLQAQLRLEID